MNELGMKRMTAVERSSEENKMCALTGMAAMEKSSESSEEAMRSVHCNEACVKDETG